MTDDLTTRLRANYYVNGLNREAAARIEALEAELRAARGTATSADIDLLSRVPQGTAEPESQPQRRARRQVVADSGGLLGAAEPTDADLGAFDGAEAQFGYEWANPMFICPPRTEQNGAVRG